MELIGYSTVDILISIVLALIMFGLGLTLSVNNFKNITLFPKAFIIGLTVQMLALPLIAFIIAQASNLPIAYKVGLILLASCPGGTTSGFITYLFKGNIALSVSLTSINSILTIFSIPFILNLTLSFYYNQSTKVHLPFFETIAQIILVAVLPVFIGIYFRSQNLITAQRIEKILKPILLILLSTVFIIKFFAGVDNGGTGITHTEVLQIIPYALLLNIACLLFAWFVGKATKLHNSDSFTISIEAAVHNTTLAILIAGTLLHNQNMVKPALIYAMFSFWTALIFGLIVKKKIV